MKRSYTKPEILFEDFTLSVNIAAGCEVIADHGMDECGYNVDKDFGLEFYVFTTQIAGCQNAQLNPNEAYDGLCYHNPSELNNVFSS